MVTLDDDTRHTLAGGDPDVMVLILGNTANIVVAESLLFCQVVDVIGLKVQDVQTLTCSHPDESS